jgi:uracil permease
MAIGLTLAPVAVHLAMGRTGDGSAVLVPDKTTLLQTIPAPVKGGIMLLLFGAIMVIGLNSLVKAGEDLTEARNFIIVALILVFGIGGMAFPAGEFTLKRIGLSGILRCVFESGAPS